MQAHTPRFSIRALFFVTTVAGLLIAVSIPAYRRASSPLLTDTRSLIVKSNTRFPVVSTRTYFSGANSDRARIVLLHRRTTPVPDQDWGPQWIPTKSFANAPFDKCIVDGQRIYPMDDATLTVVFASDNESPTTIWVPYATYEKIPWNDTDALWSTFVKRDENGG